MRLSACTMPASTRPARVGDLFIAYLPSIFACRESSRTTWFVVPGRSSLAEVESQVTSDERRGSTKRPPRAHAKPVCFSGRRDSEENMRSSTLQHLIIGVGAVAVGGGACGGQGVSEEIGIVSQADTVGGPVSGLTAAQQTLFTTGQSAFNQVETVADGLGPVFNEKSCGSCHNEASTGGAGVQIETRAGRINSGVFNPLASEGGSLFRHFGIGGQVPNRACTTTGEVVPSDANVTAGRVTTPLFGLGLVDATPDSTFQAIANGQPSSIRGVAPQVANISAGHAT